MPDAPTDKKQTRDKGLLETLRDINKLRQQSADIGNGFFEASTEHNGPSDAMRHIIFNAKLTAGTGSRIIPWLLDKLHEYGETALTGQPIREMKMDLANGELGRAIGKLNLSDAAMVDLAQRAVQGRKAATLIDDDSTKNYAEGGSVKKRSPHHADQTTDLPGVTRAIAQAAQLQNQPMVASGLLAPADKTPFGEIPELSPQELAARGTAAVPTLGMSNVGLRGANVGHTVPYYAAKGLKEENWDISPELINAYKNAGIDKLVTQKGGNYEVVVGHEGSHDVIPDEEANRRFTYERYAGKPQGGIAEAQYRVTDPNNPAFAEAVRAAYPRLGNPKYGAVRKTLEEYKQAQPIAHKTEIGFIAPAAHKAYDPDRVKSIADQLRQEMLLG